MQHVSNELCHVDWIQHNSNTLFEINWTGNERVLQFAFASILGFFDYSLSSSAFLGTTLIAKEMSTSEKPSGERFPDD